MRKIKLIKNNMTSNYRFGFLALLALMLPYSSFAGDLLLFNENSITYQSGDNYRVGDDKQSVVTFEHLSVWSWGDVFFFYDDLKQEHTGHSGYYYEVAPRLSLSKVTGQSFSYGAVKDVFIASVLERGSDGFDGLLLGTSLDWDIPGVAFFSSSFYYRDTANLAGDTWQTTLVWNVPFSIKDVDFVLDGYTDIRGAEGLNKGDLSFNPQLKMDVGKFWGYPKVLYGGIEYSYWNDKFGIDGVDERNVNALIQMKFSL